MGVVPPSWAAADSVIGGGVALGAGAFLDSMGGGLGGLATDGGGGLLEGSGANVCGAGLSFAPSTLVATPSGETPIGSLAVGDAVLAYNPTTGKSEPEPVQQVWRNDDHDLVDVQLTTTSTSGSGASATTSSATTTRLHRWVRQGALAAGLAATLLASAGGTTAQVVATTTSAASTASEVIHTTVNHPWLTTDRGWVHAGDLRPGERVVTLPGSSSGASTTVAATVAAVQVVAGAGEMDNLTVAQDHTYAVGASQVVVHNDGGPPQISSLTDYGLNLIERIRGMGVNVMHGGDDVAAWARMFGADGGTKFWGTSPAETDVYLVDAAVDHTVYEEYLHVLRGADRGWISTDYPDNYLEEAQVKEEVLQHADTLGMTEWERSAMQGQIDKNYRDYNKAMGC